MRKYLLLFMAFMFTSVGVSQDFIVLLEDETEIKSKVIEITDSTIKYKKWKNLDGPLYNIQISLVSRINFQNGVQEQFNNSLNITKTEAPVDSKVISQTEDSVSNSSLIGVPNYFNKNNNSLVPLEVAISSTERVKEGFWGHITVKYIDGINSNVRFSRRDVPVFQIQLKESHANPYTICELKQCEKKGRRAALLFKEGAGGKTMVNGLSIEFQKLNESGLYQITLPNKLSKGEYFFNIIDQNEVYAFGID